MDFRRAAIAATGGAAVAALALGAIPVGAQELPLLPISVTPTSGPAGTVATVSGGECIGDAGPGDLEAYMWDDTGDEPVLVWLGTVADDGSWTAGVMFEATDPPGTYTLSATCFAGPESDEIVADYDFVDFELTASDPAPAPPAPAPPAVEPAAAPVAAPAAAVAGQPSYTG